MHRLEKNCGFIEKKFCNNRKTTPTNGKSWNITWSRDTAKGKPYFFQSFSFWRNSHEANAVHQKTHLPTWGFWNAIALSTFNCGWSSATSHGLNSGAVVTFRRYSITVSLDLKSYKGVKCNRSSMYFFSSWDQFRIICKQHINNKWYHSSQGSY